MVRVAVVSDTHGDLSNVSRVRAQVGAVHWLLHAGDHLQDADQVAAAFGVEFARVRAVVGNCDDPQKGLAQSLIDINGIKILLTHGHLYSVKDTLDRLYYKAGEVGARVAVFGHSHVPVLIDEGGVLLFNPGSLSMPRLVGQPASCGLLEIERNEVRARHIFNI